MDGRTYAAAGAIALGLGIASALVGGVWSSFVALAAVGILVGWAVHSPDPRVPLGRLAAEAPEPVVPMRVRVMVPIEPWIAHIETARIARVEI